MKHLRHKWFAPGCPIKPYWSEMQLFCSTCKCYFRSKPLHLLAGIKWEIKNIDNHLLRFAMRIKLMKFVPYVHEGKKLHVGEIKWFFQK